MPEGCVIHAAMVTLQRGRVNCLKLLTEWRPDEVCDAEFVKTAAAHARCSNYLSGKLPQAAPHPYDYVLRMLNRVGLRSVEVNQ